MTATRIIAAVFTVLVVGAGAVAAAPVSPTDVQPATDAVDPGDDHAANASADARSDAPGSNATLPEQASETAKSVQATITNWFGADDADREHDTLGDAVSATASNDTDAGAEANQHANAHSNGNADAAANGNADAAANGNADAAANGNAGVATNQTKDVSSNASVTGQSSANANASVTGQSSPNANASVTGLCHAVASVFGL